MRRQVLSLLVENNPGVTSHISGLFSRRGYNIDSFSSGVTADPRYTRITIVASGDVIELTGHQDKLDAFLDLLQGYEILELARTGITGLSRGTADVKMIDENGHLQSL